MSKWHKFERSVDPCDGKEYLSCEELPEEDQNVLFCVKTSDGKYQMRTGTFDTDYDGCLIDSDNGEEIDDSWYWTELPEPPEEKEEKI